MMKLLKCGGVTYAKIAVKRFLEGKMNNIIKCPICHEMAGLRYNENRVYQSRCQNMKCRETFTVTAPSGKAAEGLFSKFEKGMSQPKLSIPKKIAEIADETWGYGDIDPIDIFGDVRLPDFERWWKSQEHPKDLIVAYLAGGALGVELVEVSDD